MKAHIVAGLLLWRRSERIALLLRQGAVLQFILIAAAFGALIQAFVTSDFSLKLAVEHSNSQQPLLFKINMEAGHGGKSGRFQRLHEVAEEYAFMLDLVGIGE